jgi:DNA-binding XRE family transcriptional regulator
MDALTLKTWQEHRELTQDEAGAAVGVNRRVVAGWETGQTRNPQMTELAIWAIDHGQILQSN